MLILNLLKKKNTSPIIGEVFDDLFTNTSVYEDRGDYTIRTTSSRYNFMYSGDLMSVKGISTLGGTFWNYIEIFINDVYYQSLQINNTSYQDITLPVGGKKITILSGICSRPNNVGDIKSTFLTGLSLDTTRYTKLNVQNNNTEYVFLGDSITVGDHAFTSINGYANLFYKEDKLSTTILGWGWARLFDFGSDSGKITECVARIIDAFKSAPNKKLIIALGTNDMALDGRSASDFIGYARNLINAIVSADPTIQIFYNEPLYRNGDPALLQSYRTELANLSTELGTFTVIPCKNACTYPSDYADSVHPNNQGHKKYKDFVATYINL